MLLMIPFLFLTLSGCVNLERQRSKKVSHLPPHHTPKGFQNLYKPPERGFGDFLRWQLGLGPREIPVISPEEIADDKSEMVQAAIQRIQQSDSNQIQVTWIGHSTFLIQVGGINILTDPIFSERCGPFSFLGVKRVAPPGISFEELPQIHAVLISHNHYDHLDAPTVKRLGNRPTYFVPLGLAKWFKKKNINHVIELDWWQSSSFHGLNFHSDPSPAFLRTDAF